MNIKTFKQDNKDKNYSEINKLEIELLNSEFSIKESESD